MGISFHIRRLKAELLLLLAALIWGLAFVAQRKGMESIGPFAFNGIRFLLGSISLIPLAWWPFNKKKAGLPKPLQIVPISILWPGIFSGGILFIAASLQQIGMVYTTAGSAGFITSLYVVFVPIILIFWKHKITRQIWFGALLAVSGLFLLSFNKQMELNPGDAFVLASAVFFAVHVIIIGHYAPRVNVLKLSVMQFFVCGLLSLVTAFLLETTHTEDVVGAAIPILYGGLMSVGVAYTLQVVAQRHAQASHAAIILSLESLFAALGGWLILSEEMTVLKMCGAALMLFGVILSQINKPKI